MIAGEFCNYNYTIPIKFIFDEKYRNNFKKEKEDENAKKEKIKKENKERVNKEKGDKEYQQFLLLKKKFENEKNTTKGEK